MESDHLEDLDTDSRTVLQEIGWEGMDWILLVGEMGLCKTVVNTVMICTVP